MRIVLRQFVLGLSLVYASGALAQELTAIEVARLLPSDVGAFDEFAYALALDGDTALISAPEQDGPDGERDAGAVYVYVRGGDGRWSERQKIVAEDPIEEGRFGTALALDGNTALIGALGGRFSESSVYEYARGADGRWTARRKLLSPGPGSLFGRALALDGDTALIGMPFATVAGRTSGAAYLYTRDASGEWGEPTRLLPLEPPPADFASFGSVVALDGGIALVGQDRYDTAHAYARDEGESWMPTQTLVPGEPTANTLFGSSLALDGDTALIGASGESVDGFPKLGAAYVYTREPADGTWNEGQRLTVDEASRRSFLAFGDALALDGDVALVGVERDATAAERAGAAYLYARGEDDLWVLQAKLLASDSDVLDEFGSSVVLDGDTALIGAFGGVDEFDSPERPGAAYVFAIEGGGSGDADGDGVADADDLCPRTTLGVTPTVRATKNRFYADERGVFVDGRGNEIGVDIVSTGGCSGQQIIEAADLSSSNERYGIWRDELLAWVYANGPGPVGDADADGVPDDEERCLGLTVLGVEPTVRATKNRYYVDERGVFVDGRGNEIGVDIISTGGCSGQQIVEAADLSSSNERYGVWGYELRRWVRER